MLLTNGINNNGGLGFLTEKESTTTKYNGIRRLFMKQVYSMLDRQKAMAKYKNKRIHGSQLKKPQEKRIWKALKSVEESGKTWRIRNHAFDRVKEKGINATYDDMVSTIHNSSIIEYRIFFNSTYNRCEERVVLRSKEVVNRCFNLNVVYSLSANKIITVWLNHINDDHKNLDWSLYDENMRVFGSYE